MLKIFACIAVVGLHTLQKDISVLNSTLYYLCGFAVPAFFASSGAFLMNRESASWKYVIKKICLILRVVIAWNVLIIGAELVLNAVFHLELDISVLTIPQEILVCLLQGGTLWHFWYFGALIILYLLLPFLHRLTLKQRIILIAVTSVISIGLQIASTIEGAPLQRNVIQTFRLWTWLFYFVGGGVLYDSIQSGKFKDISIKTSCILLLAMTAFISVYQNLIGRYVILESTGVLHAEYFYDSFFTMIWIFLLFICVKSIKMSEKLTVLVSRIAPLTMGIYIVHPLVIRLCKHFVTVDTVLVSIIFFAIVLLSSVIIAAVISRIPVVRHLIKL